MRKLLAGLAVGWAALFLGWSTAPADTLSVSADLPVAFEFDDSDIDSDGVSGYKVGVSVPLIFAGVGMEDYTVDEKDGAEITYNFFDLFLDIPFPILNVGLGAGIGQVEVTNAGAFDSDGDASQWWASLGIPFGAIFDVHVAHHVITADTDKVDNLDGQMTSVGIKIGF